jgi:hypothetical protein
VLIEPTLSRSIDYQPVVKPKDKLVDVSNWNGNLEAKQAKNLKIMTKNISTELILHNIKYQTTNFN